MEKTVLMWVGLNYRGEEVRCLLFQEVSVKITN
jgi:hypothetical protein